MAEARFYRKHDFTCPRCGFMLEWRPRPGRPDSMMLSHPAADCPNSRKNFYPPVETLAEIPEEMLKV